MKDIVHAKGKLYYSMGEVCEIFGVKPSLIRYWENEFRILRPSRNSKGNRMYTPKDVDNIKLIYHLVKEKGMTLAGADKRLRQNPDGILREAEVVEHLQHIRSMLVELRSSLGDEENVVAEFEDNEEDFYADEVAVDSPLTESIYDEVIIEKISSVEEPIVAEPAPVVEEPIPVVEEAAPETEEAAPADEPTEKKPAFVEVAMFPEEELAPKAPEKRTAKVIVEQTLF